jgi:hypothetical protein
MAFLTGDEQRGETTIRGLVDSRTCDKQHCHHLSVASAAGEVQRGATCIRGGVHFHPSFE